MKVKIFLMKGKDDQKDVSFLEGIRPFFDPFRCAADASCTETVATTSNLFAAIAALLVFTWESVRGAAPVANAAKLIRESSTADSETVHPPAIATNTLTHFRNNYKNSKFDLINIGVLSLAHTAHSTTNLKSPLYNTQRNKLPVSHPIKYP